MVPKRAYLYVSLIVGIISILISKLGIAISTTVSIIIHIISNANTWISTVSILISTNTHNKQC